MGFANSLKLGEAFENHHHLKILMSPCLYVQIHSINHSHRQERTIVFKQDLLRVVGRFGRHHFVVGAKYFGVKVQVWLSLHPITAEHLPHPSGNLLCIDTGQLLGLQSVLAPSCARAEVKMPV